MRNIELTSTYCYKGLPTDAQIGCVDPLKEDVYFITQEEVLRLNCESQELKSCLKFGAIGLLPEQKIISLVYLTDQDALCIITDAGEISLFHLSTEQTESVGSFDDGLKVASWSPDGNNLVLITGSDSIIYMNRDFDIRHEIPLYSSVDAEDEAVSVGWGKKETQFHGSEGKAAALKMETKVSPYLAWDDMQLRISWQGDGQLFAVSCLSSESYRQVRIFSCEGIMRAISEPLNGLEMEISWKPSGSLIAALQRTPTKYQVIFLERNGLEHGKFSLPYTQDEILVKQLLWNPSSSLLAVRIEMLPNNNSLEPDGISKIHIWSCSNYHWYLKQTLTPNIGSHQQSGEKFVQCLWHPEKPNTLLYLTSSGFYRECNWDWKIHRSRGFSKHNKAYVAVIDGDKVLLTPFRNKIVPPPHAFHTCKLPSFVNSVIFPSHSEEDKLVAVLSNNQLVMISINNEQISVSQSLSLTWDNSAEHKHGDFLHHWLWINEKILLAVYSENFTSHLCGICIDQDTAVIKMDLSKLQQVISLCVIACGRNIIYQLHDGSLEAISEDTFKRLQSHQGSPLHAERFPSMAEYINFPCQCHHIETCNVSDHNLVFGLTKHFQLFCGNVELMKNCSSFALHDKFLVATSLDHMLHCISLTSCLDAVLRRTTLTDEVDNLRNVERGSYIMTCVPEDTKVILQMPRGNLECIHPRALVVSTIAGYLDNLKFYDAFSLMRRHRINLNLLFDHSPKLFLNNIEKFVTDVDNVTWLNVFLSDLSDDNVTMTLYAKIYNASNQQLTSTYPNKVNVICEKMRDILEKIDCKKFLFVILSTYALMKPPALESALNLINGLKNKENGENAVDGALTHLTYLVDVNELFNIAIGTYDFELVIMVAQKTQKDPKEYLPFLNELKTLEEYYRRYKIDCHLKRPVKALENIVKAGHEYFDECLDHIKNYHLYKQGLSLHPDKESMEYKTICSMYADYLREKHRHDEAGIFYCRRSSPGKALDAYEHSLNWQHTMMLASMTREPSKVAELGASLARRLKEKNNYRDAAYLLEVHAKQIDESILTLIEGHDWARGLEMIHRYRKYHLLESHFRPGLQEHNKSLLNTIETMKALFQRHVNRLMVVRENKLDAQHLLGLSEDVDDSSSEITSITESSARTQLSSATSRMTGRTSRNRRKEERKKHSLKEGSYYEDRALMEALNEIAVNADHMKEECSNLVHMLLVFEYDENASLLQNNFAQFLQLISENTLKIWLAPLENIKVVNENLHGEQIYDDLSRQNSVSLKEVIKFIQPPSMKQINWELDFLKPD